MKQAYKQFNKGKPKNEMIREPLLVFLSAHLEKPGFKEKCQAAGVEQFYSKPIDVRDLRTLDKIIKQRMADL